MISTLILLSLFIGITVLLIVIQKKLDNKYLMILPILCFIFSIYKSIPNFEKSFYIQFSLGAFLASLLYLMFLNIPTIALLIVSKKSVVVTN
ncbi:hypothetical protein [Amedibacillus sp. YH-ame10]